MQNFVFENPTKIIFGKDQIKKIGKEIGKFGRRALMVYGQGSIRKNGVYDQVVASLNEAGIGIVEFPGVKSNPVLSYARQGIEIAKKEKVDVVLAVGGGSVMDTAKTIAAGAQTDDDVWDYFVYKKAVQGALPLLTVVTISASASEMNQAAVITKEDSAQKYSFRSPFVQPKTSILDPTVLFSLSPAYSAYSAVDTMAHMLEPYFVNTEPNSPLQDRLVEGLAKTVMESTEAILKDPADYDARANMMWAAILGFNGTTTAGMGRIGLPVHMMEHSLSALYDIPHGAGLSILLPGWMRYALEKDPAKFARLARTLFAIEEQDDGQAGTAGTARLREWFTSIGAPVCLGDAKIPERDVGKIARNASALAALWGLTDYTEEVIASILTTCA